MYNEREIYFKTHGWRAIFLGSHRLFHIVCLSILITGNPGVNLLPLDRKMKRVKQVIVVRNDLAMDMGKAFSQVAHASMKFLADKIRKGLEKAPDGSAVCVDLSEAERIWFEGKFTKIVLAVSSESELLQIKEECESRGISTALIVDDGTTVFNGVPTPTCLGIGPAFADKIDLITRSLKLFK